MLVGLYAVVDILVDSARTPVHAGLATISLYESDRLTYRWLERPYYSVHVLRCVAGLVLLVMVRWLGLDCRGRGCILSFGGTGMPGTLSPLNLWIAGSYGTTGELCWFGLGS